MRVCVALTDRDWLESLRGRYELDEVCFWQAASPRPLRSLRVGEPLLFIGHVPERRIAGGGFLVHATTLPLSLLWRFFADKAGGASRDALLRRVGRARGAGPGSRDPELGCMVLQSFFLFDPDELVAPPDDFHPNVSRGKFYEVEGGAGERLWRAVHERLEAGLPGGERSPQEGLFGDPVLLPRRVGAGGFRSLVLDAYGRRCAVTGLALLPALAVAAIRPLADGGLLRVDNGLLLRADLAQLFAGGDLTIDEEGAVRLSPRARAASSELARLDGSPLSLPRRRELRPRPEALRWHRRERSVEGMSAESGSPTTPEPEGEEGRS
ncbi:MAG TPA: HNH endonuclease [Thermoanaerobaculia bacterium]|nr:HNH endonuclease [Thermoanaerobaculia bacterium]